MRTHQDTFRWWKSSAPYLVDDADGVPDVDLLVGLPQLTPPGHRPPQQQPAQVVLVKLLPPQRTETGVDRQMETGVDRQTDGDRGGQTDRDRGGQTGTDGQILQELVIIKLFNSSSFLFVSGGAAAPSADSFPSLQQQLRPGRGHGP